MTNNDPDFKAFKIDLRNAPIIFFTADSIGFRPNPNAPTSSLCSRRLPDGSWVKVDG